MDSIRFPKLGFEVFVNKGFSVFGLEIAIYGITMALGMIFGAIVAYNEAKRTGQKVDDYVDYTIFGIIFGIIGARLYYVAFEWDQYKNDLVQILNLRAGGLAIYGAVIGSVLCAIIFCKIKKMSFWKFADTAVFGLLTGQIIGRWGNFFNREAYGCYTDNIFAMQIPVKDAAVVNDAITVTVNGAQYVQVHPTFLYESVLNLLLIVLLIIFRNKKKFRGETFCRYLVGYGIIRFFLEGLRVDQLQIKGVAVSQVLSAVLAIAALVFIIVKYLTLKGKKSEACKEDLELTLKAAQEKLEKKKNKKNRNDNPEDVSDDTEEPIETEEDEADAKAENTGEEDLNEEPEEETEIDAEAEVEAEESSENYEE